MFLFAFKLFLFALSVVFIVTLICFRSLRRKGVNGVKSVGFVHPAATGGGGGERVLWLSIKALQQYDQEQGISNRTVVLYYSQSATIKSNSVALAMIAKKQFGVEIDADRLIVVPLNKFCAGFLLDEHWYPRLTLLLQSAVGGTVLGLTACQSGACDVMVDTVGVSFSYPIYKFLAGSIVWAYVHYPIISTDMIQRVASGQQLYNNQGLVARSRWLSQVKIYYYRCVAFLYRIVGNCARIVVCNSSWTRNHIVSLWHCNPTVVFPPADLKSFLEFPLVNSRRNHIVSIGQFRPEKNHVLQIEAFADALPSLPKDALLILVGGARNAEDLARVDKLKALIEEKKLQERVKIEVSVPFDRIKLLLQTCSVGLHTMTDEHFGIVIVEYMASGCVPLAHNSGGVKADIVEPNVHGILATTQAEYTDGMIKLLNDKPNEDEHGMYRCMQEAGRKKSLKFGDAEYGKEIAKAFFSTL